MENASAPHSDQKIVEILKEKNINIARRTVTKYREMMSILPSHIRKKAF
jgi:RNA polymerase sigma-54 factor